VTREERHWSAKGELDSQMHQGAMQNEVTPLATNQSLGESAMFEFWNGMLLTFDHPDRVPLSRLRRPGLTCSLEFQRPHLSISLKVSAENMCERIINPMD
jgi:hypothetical protein